MPVFDFFHWSKDSGYTLKDSGPIIPVVIGIPKALEEFCLQKGISIPSPVSGFALIDTGASSTAVHEEIFTDFGVQPIDLIQTATPSTSGMSFVYPAKVTFPALQVYDYRMDRVVGCNLKWKTSDNKEIIMLLGRDILAHFLLIYNGPYSDVTLAY